MLPQSYNNDAAIFRNQFAILQYFNETILQYISNLCAVWVTAVAKTRLRRGSEKPSGPVQDTRALTCNYP